jgi:hypothetical protein
MNMVNAGLQGLIEDQATAAVCQFFVCSSMFQLQLRGWHRVGILNSTQHDNHERCSILVAKASLLFEENWTTEEKGLYAIGSDDEKVGMLHQFLTRLDAQDLGFLADASLVIVMGGETSGRFNTENSGEINRAKGGFVCYYIVKILC